MPQGSGGNYAWIRVRTTDPILFNQNVTASINSKTLGADTISAYSGVGIACVAVPKKGTYTVTAKNAYDGKTVTQTETVSEKGQVVECSMQSTYSTLTVNVYDTKEDKNRIGGTYKLYKGDVIYAEGTLSTSGPTTIVSQASGTCLISTLVNSKERTKDADLAIGSTLNIDFYTVLDTSVTFSRCSDEEFTKIIAALDDGTITTNDLTWAVGDTRTVNLSAMSATGVGELHNAETVTFVIQNVGGVTLSNGKECHYVVGLLNSLATTGYMNSSNTNSGSWKSSARRTWCNSVFRNAIPSTIRDCFKQFKCVTATEYSASTTTTTDDYFALPAAKEVFGGTATSAGSETSYSNLTEFNALTQFEWYKTSANRIKKLGNSSSASWWWERSPRYANGGYFCCVDTAGTAHDNSASSAGGLAPFGCI